MKIGTFASSIVKRIIDNFNRTTVGSLGTATSGQTWDATRGVWFANGTMAQSTDAANTNPIASIPFASSAVLSADITGGGVGLAYWITDSDDWWASFVDYVQNPNVVFTCNLGQVTNTSNPPSPSCCSDVTTTPGGQVCNAGYTSSTNSSIFCSITGTSGGGSSCTGNYQSSTSSAGFCNITGSTYYPGSCNQNYATGLSSTSPCCSGATPNTTYSCCCGGSLSGSTCNVPSYSSYVGFGPNAPGQCQDQGGTYSGGYCTYPAYSYGATPTTTYSCYTASSSGYTVYTGYTSYVTNPTVYSGYTSYTQEPTQYSCYTQNSSVTTYTYNTQIKMISSVSGNVVTESSSNIVVDAPAISPVQSLKVVTNNGQVTTTAYSNTGLQNQLGNPLVVTPVNPAQATPVGIIKTQATYNQGDTLDNFEATI